MDVGQAVSHFEECSQEKDLRVTFNECLNVDVHIQNVTSKAMFGSIKRTFTFLDSKSL